MTPTNDLDTLWGSGLIAEARRRYPDPDDLDEEEFRRLYSLFTRRGCVLEPPGRGVEIRDLVSRALTGEVDPLFVPRHQDEEEEIGGGALPPELGPKRGERRERQALRRAGDVAGPVVEATDGNSSDAQDRARSKAQEIQRLRAEVERARTEIQESEQEAEIRRLRRQLVDLRTRRRRVEPAAGEEMEISADITPPATQPRPIFPRLNSTSNGGSGEKTIGESMKLIMKLLPPSDRFSGRDNRNVAEDLAIFERLCAASQVPTHHWGQILYFILRDDARRFYRTQNTETQNNYNRMKRALIDRYLSPEKLDRIKMQYNNLSLRSCSTLEKYGEELLRLYKMLPEGYATEASLIDKLVLGVVQEEVTRQYRTVRPATYAAAMELVRVWARPAKKPMRALAVTQVAPIVSRRGNNPPPRKRLQNPRCGLCGLYGHYTRECPDLTEEMRNFFNKKYRQNNPYIVKGGKQSANGERNPSTPEEKGGAPQTSQKSGASSSARPTNNPGN